MQESILDRLLSAYLPIYIIYLIYDSEKIINIIVSYITRSYADLLT